MVYDRLIVLLLAQGSLGATFIGVLSACICVYVCVITYVRTFVLFTHFEIESFWCKTGGNQRSPDPTLLSVSLCNVSEYYSIMGKPLSKRILPDNTGNGKW